MRNKQATALILGVKAQGESNRLVTYLSPEEGICTSILYGGPKSKLKSLVSPWNCGTIYIYSDEVKHTSKITDFDVQKYHLSFRESLFKTWAANLATEIVLLSKCGGSPEECFTLINGFLDGLDLSDERQGQTGLIRFLWRYMALLGIQVGDYKCTRCQKPFYSRNTEQNVIEYKAGGAIYSQSENGFVCSDCINLLQDKNEKQHFGELTSKAVVYLEATSLCEPSVSRKMKLTDDEISQLKNFTFSMIENGIGTKIKTLKSGIGIL
ncbi:DNA repair protein RecO [Treponema sp.]|uniref:DNA repair protein RecO n=1 Tax=Treponema sp. TaxID=166 RepID=UPI00298DE8C8|nr:recombination protein O N-terminal domain-containing protein [Treponema sp.]MCR5612985.1 recombination protein O N-terminal domain-containing protein [Treponema sp.]